MGKKTMKNSEKEPSHKRRLNIHKTPVGGSSSSKKKQQHKGGWREIRQEKLEGLLQLGLDRNDEAVQRLNNEINDISRQRMLAKNLVKVPINPPFSKEMIPLKNKMFLSAKEVLSKAVQRLLRGKLLEKFGRSYRSFVAHLMEFILLKVHLRCLQEDAGLSDQAMAEMDPLHVLRIFDAVVKNNTHPSSGERAMKVLVCVFGLDNSYPRVQDIMTELVEKMVKAFAEVAPQEEAMAVFAKAARENATAHAMGLAVQAISFDR